MDNQSATNFVRHVVIEPPKEPVTVSKQYFCLSNFHDGEFKGKKDEIIWLAPSDAEFFLANRFIVPLNVAIRQGLYPKKDESLLGKIKAISDKADERPVVETLKETTNTLQEASKKLLGNKLRDIVQGKKSEDTSKATLTADKLAAIRAGGKK